MGRHKAYKLELNNLAENVEDEITTPQLNIVSD